MSAAAMAQATPEGFDLDAWSRIRLIQVEQALVLRFHHMQELRCRAAEGA